MAYYYPPHPYYYKSKQTFSYDDSDQFTSSSFSTSSCSSYSTLKPTKAWSVKRISRKGRRKGTRHFDKKSKYSKKRKHRSSRRFFKKKSARAKHSKRYHNKTRHNSKFILKDKNYWGKGISVNDLKKRSYYTTITSNGKKRGLLLNTEIKPKKYNMNNVNASQTGLSTNITNFSSLEETSNYDRSKSKYSGRSGDGYGSIKSYLEFTNPDQESNQSFRTTKKFDISKGDRPSQMHHSRKSSYAPSGTAQSSFRYETSTDDRRFDSGVKWSSSSNEPKSRMIGVSRRSGKSMKSRMDFSDSNTDNNKKNKKNPPASQFLKSKILSHFPKKQPLPSVGNSDPAPPWMTSVKPAQSQAFPKDASGVFEEVSEVELRDTSTIIALQRGLKDLRNRQKYLNKRQGRIDKCLCKYYYVDGYYMNYPSCCNYPPRC